MLRLGRLVTARKQTGGGSGVPPASQPAVRPRGWPLWVWPPLAAALIAVAGYKFGIAGALATTASAIAALIFVAGDLLYSGQRRRAWAVAALSLAIIAITVLMWQVKIPWLRMREVRAAASPGPVELRGVDISRAQAAKLDFRGAQLAGAVLDGLNLRRKQMEGITAPGASFRHTDLSFASLRGADLDGADLSYACLIGTDFTGALLDGANVDHATFDIHALPRSIAAKLTGIPVSPRADQLTCP